MKILGINFHNFGISHTNYIQLEKKLEQAIYLWSSVKMNMPERTVVSKTFLLSKIYFLAQILVFSKKFIKKVEKKNYLYGMAT